MHWKNFIFSLMAVSGGVLHAAEAERPNILWLVSEDNDPFLGCYGDPIACTPTLDKLASEGVLYERCFAQPCCAPSRFMLITGMDAATCGPAHHMRAQGLIPSWLKGFPALLRQAGYYTSNHEKTDYNSPISVKEAWDDSSKEAGWRNRPDPGQPFFSVFNYEVTHEYRLFPEHKEVSPDFTPTDPAKVRIPSYQPDTPEMRTDWAYYYDQMRRLDKLVALKLKELEKDGLADNTIVFYYSDNGGVLPRSKRFLEESGIRVPLIVYYPPKWRHLAPAAPGSRIKEPVSFVDFAPTILSLAGVKIPDYMQGRAFAGPAKGAPNEFVFSTRDRLDERYDMMRSVEDSRWLFIHNFRPDLPYVQPMSYPFSALGYQSWAREAAAGRLTAETSRFWGQKPVEELYDMEADPDSVTNLADSPAHKETLEKMRAALKAHMLAIKDNGLLPEGSALEGYDATRAPGAWPVERAFDMAILASAKDPKNLPELIRELDDDSEPVRWWAAQGCAMLGEKAASATAVLERRLKDPSGAVAVASAEALARIGKPDLALPVLEHWIKRTGATVRQAGNVLDRLGEIARPALPAMKEVLAAWPGKQEDYKDPRYILKHTVDVLEGKIQALVYPPAQSAKIEGGEPTPN